MHSSPYESLLGRVKEASIVGSIGSTLHWDQETGMPAAGTGWRADQLAWVSSRAHAIISDAETGRLLEAAEGLAPAADSDQAVNLRWLRRDYERATRLPPKFVEECAHTEAMAQEAWREARAQSDFPKFAPFLEKLVNQARRRAAYLGNGGKAYDALLDLYEPGATSESVGLLFDSLAPRLQTLVAAAGDPSIPAPAPLPNGPYPAAAQERFNQKIAAAVGFDFASGRIDTSTHPFCTTLGPLDHRLTTRYDETDFTSSLYGVLHEAGHGMYEQGLDPHAYGLPCGSAISLGVHESQSRLWENHVGRKQAFWNHWYPWAVECFPQLAAVTPHALWRHANRVRRSFIRVEADEVTYDLHIILRFRLECALIGGELEARDIPSAWNTMFSELLGLEVRKDAEGCLQDVHWSGGGFGYFATYTLGNINAAHLMSAAGKNEPELGKALEAGNYAPLLNWLRTRVHQSGMRKLPAALIAAASGSPVTADAHLAHLEEKVSAYCAG